MMPVFFNAGSHLWIAYLFFVNGLMAAAIIRTYSEGFREITRPLEAQVLAGFFLSLLLNGGLLLVFDLLAWRFAGMLWALSGLTTLLAVTMLLAGGMRAGLSDLFADCGKLRLLLYLCVFLVLFYNGGLIDQLSDAWWHMSLANKIALANSYGLEHGHLNGVSNRYYPPLWHANLALAKILSGSSLPVLWNSFTAWGAVLKVMAFYLFAYALSGQRSLALLSALLFFLLPGIGDSYMRVSAWPSHIAYSAWFCLFYTMFQLLDNFSDQSSFAWRTMAQSLRSQCAAIVSMVGLALVIFYSHQLELVWFAVAITVYFMALIARRAVAGSPLGIEKNSMEISLIGCLGMIGVLGLSIWLIVTRWTRVYDSPDLVISYLLPILVLGALLVAYILGRQWQATHVRANRFVVTIFALLAAALLASIDITHIKALFFPELAGVNKLGHQYALIEKGWFGDDLVVPGWHLQLRYGLLYSAIVSLPVSIFLAYRVPSRLTLFTAAGTTTALLFCSSPYLYQWLTDVSGYHSPWRIAVLVFHPVILAQLLFFAAEWGFVTRSKVVKQAGLAPAIWRVIAVAVTMLILYDTRYHFDSGYVSAKITHQSAQRNWSAFFPQREVYVQSSFRYQSDLQAMERLVTPGTTLLSDMATSYYAAAALPVYVVNVHKHHGRQNRREWQDLLSNRTACYLDNEASREKFIRFAAEINDHEPQPHLAFRYVVLNKDRANRNLRRDCLAIRSHRLSGPMLQMAELLYSGEYLDLYLIRQLD